MKEDPGQSLINDYLSDQNTHRASRFLLQIAFFMTIIGVLVIVAVAVLNYLQQNSNAEPIRIAQPVKFKTVPERGKTRNLRIGELHNPRAVEEAEAEDKRIQITPPQDDAAGLLIKLPPQKPVSKNPQSAITQAERKMYGLSVDQDKAENPESRASRQKQFADFKEKIQQNVVQSGQNILQSMSDLLPQTQNQEVVSDFVREVVRAPIRNPEKPKQGVGVLVIDAPYVVQVYSLASAEQAEKLRHLVMQKHVSGILGSSVAVHRVQLPEIGLRHRVYVTGFNDIGSATRWCTDWFAKTGDECFPKAAP